jgi:hypothetical protein
MKIVLSRKGFDSSSGHYPSPILPDNRLVSLPIPDERGHLRLADLRPRGLPLGEIASALTRGKISPATTIHLDPDLEESTIPRLGSWRPAFGQSGPAARHLDKLGVEVGDLFLFFGWFRQVEATSRGLRYKPRSPHLHVIFGWLVIGSIVIPDRARIPPGLEHHPHCDGSPRTANRVYVGKVAGVFPTFAPELQLTADGSGRSHWRLPGWFYPSPGKPAMTYHEDLDRWSKTRDGVSLATVGRGQEFILDVTSYPEALGWARGLGCGV